MESRILSEQLDQITEYFLELDALKLTHRRTYINGGERLENSAEHSWHLAMACWSLARSFQLDVSEEKLLKLALIHDLGEIDAGDTFLYATTRAAAPKAERSCVKRLEGHPGNGVSDLAEIWEEQETGVSNEVKLLKATDRLLPFLHNIASEGKTWREFGIKRSQVSNAHQFIESDFPQIYAWVQEKLALAVRNGWLEDA